MQTKALFIGQSYIDITFVTDHMPSGDEKTVARDYAVSFGGNAVTAAFACAKLGIAPDLLASVADDWLGRMFIDMAAKYGISVHHRKVAESSRCRSSCRKAISVRSCAAATTISNIRFRCSISPAAARSMSTDICPTPPSTMPRSVTTPAS
jgi:hypothetical protein